MKRFVGRVGHSKNPLKVEDMVLLQQAINKFDMNIIRFAICRENNCHAHIYIEAEDCLQEKAFKKALFLEIYEVLDKFKKTGKGGDQFVTMKEIKYDTKKYKELTPEQQIEFQSYYVFKDFDPEKISEYILSVITIEDALLYKKLYYDYLSIIAKNKKALNGPGKALTIRDKLLNYFNEKRHKRTIATGEVVNIQMNLDDILSIVCDFYAHELEVPHTSHDIERYTMLLWSKFEPDSYTSYMYQKVLSKLHN